MSKSKKGRKGRESKKKGRKTTGNMVFRRNTVLRVMRAALRKFHEHFRMGMDTATLQWAYHLIMDRIDFLLREVEQRAWSIGEKRVSDVLLNDVLQQQETDESRRSYLRLRFGGQ